MFDKNAIIIGLLIGIAFAIVWSIAGLMAKDALAVCETQKVMSYNACKIEATR